MPPYDHAMTNLAMTPHHPADGTPALQRVKGRASVSLAADRSDASHPQGARLVGLHQSGSAKAFLPRVHSPVPEVVFLNTAGGLTGGDDMRWTLDLAPGAQAVATTQTAERAYGARPGHGPARANITLRLGEGASLDWLPQETILYQNSALARHTRIDMAPGSRLLYAEAVVLGRAAMGETVTDLTLEDRREVLRDGVPLALDVLRLRAGGLDTAATALLGTSRAVATVLWVWDGVEDRLDQVRQHLAACCTGVRAAASAWDGKCVIRLAAPSGWPLRVALAALLERLREASLPRVWQI